MWWKWRAAIMGHMNDHSDVGTEAPPAQPGHVKRLYRRMDTKMIAGVAAGVADYFDVDPTLVRIGFVIAAFLGGVGVLAYGVAWILVPPSFEQSTPGESFVRRLKAAPSWFGIALLAVGVVLLTQAYGLMSPPVGWGIALVILGVLLFRHASTREVGTGPVPPPPPGPGGLPAPPPPPPPASPMGFEPVERGLAPPPAPPGGMWVPAPAPASARVRRPRDRWLWWATLGAALLAVGVAALLANAGVVDVGVRGYVSLALAVLGLGLVGGGWWGRSRGLIVLALLLTPVVLLASLVNVPFQGGVGERFYGPRVVSDLRPAYRQVAGRMVLDLSGLRLGTETASPIHLDATMVAGSIEVILPRGVRASVHAKAGAGQLVLLGIHSDGLNIDEQRAAGPVAGGDLDIDLQVSFGRIVVYRS